MLEESNGNFNNEYNNPDIEQCKATLIIGNHDAALVSCLVESPFCQYSLGFGFRILCRHPKRMEIVQKTAASQG